MEGIGSASGGFNNAKTAKTANTANPWRLAVLPSRLGRAVPVLVALDPVVGGAVLGRLWHSPGAPGLCISETSRNFAELAETCRLTDKELARNRLSLLTCDGGATSVHCLSNSAPGIPRPTLEQVPCGDVTRCTTSGYGI